MRGELKAVRVIAAGAAAVVALFVAVLLVLPSSAAAKTVWLCKPGIANNPCTPDLSTTQISPTGEALGTTQPKKSKKPKFDCFYVYPTVSDDEGVNSDRSIDPEERSIALYQASRYSQRCRVFAPMYRQLTLGAIFGGPIGEEEQALAYGDVLTAWKTYLREYNKGRGVVLIGHSQGSLVLQQLIADQIDPKPRLQRRIISALCSAATCSPTRASSPAARCRASRPASGPNRPAAWSASRPSTRPCPRTPPSAGPGTSSAATP